MDAVIAARQGRGAKAVSDADLVRAIAVAAALGEWRRVESAAGMLDSDAARLDALSRAFAVSRD